MDEDEELRKHTPLYIKVVALIVVAGLVLLMANLFFGLLLGWFD
jgi:hypothetical protein